MRKIILSIIIVFLTAGCGSLDLKQRSEIIKKYNNVTVIDYKRPPKRDKKYQTKNIIKEKIKISTKQAKDKEIEAIVVKPAVMEPEKKYPVLYLLHGIGDDGDDWVNNAGLMYEYDEWLEINKGKEFIIVLIDSGNSGQSWYTNWVEEKNRNYENYFENEVVPYIESNYPVDTTRGKRGIGGFSMGGYGAYKLGLKNIDKFGSVSSIAGALNLNRVSFEREKLGIMSLLFVPQESVFGDRAKLFIRVFGSGLWNWHKENPREIMEKMIAKERVKLDMTEFYLDTGSEDTGRFAMALVQWQDMNMLLHKNKVDFKSVLVEKGEHTWEYAGTRLKSVFDFHSEVFFR